MLKIKAGNERNSPAIAKFSNEDIDYFGLKLVVHVLIRGSLVLFRQGIRPVLIMDFISRKGGGKNAHEF